MSMSLTPVSGMYLFIFRSLILLLAYNNMINMIFIIYTEYSHGMIAGVDPDPTCRGRVHLRLAHYKGPRVEQCKKRWADESDESM